MGWRGGAERRGGAVRERARQKGGEGRTEIVEGAGSEALLVAGGPVGVWISQGGGADGEP